MAAEGEIDILGKNQMLEYLMKCGIRGFTTYSDGALVNPVMFPVGAVETEGAVLFADLPGFSKLATDLDPIECAYYGSHFFHGLKERRVVAMVVSWTSSSVMR